MSVFSLNGSKAWGEKFFLLTNLLSLAGFLVVFISMGLYKSYDDRNSYLVVSLLLAAPNIVYPLLFPGKVDRSLPCYQRFVVKANVWNAIFGFIGNYVWTHYFYQQLGATYTFDTYRLNDVPVPCFLATHAYFCLYHTLTSIILRQVQNLGRKLPKIVRISLFALSVLGLSYLTAFLETLTIAAFPHYTFEDKGMMYKVGSALYALYFVVSFPMYLRLDESHAGRRWTLGEFALDAFAAAMIVTLLLDAWRLVIGPIYTTTPATAAPARMQSIPFLLDISA